MPVQAVGKPMTQDTSLDVLIGRRRGKAYKQKLGLKFIDLMLENENHWDVISKSTIKIVKIKEEEEWARQNRENGNT